ncbi:MAG: DUF6603 domain-containing protein [Bacteroidia bacterium]
MNSLLDITKLLTTSTKTLINSFSDVEAFKSYLWGMGWDVTSLPQEYTDLINQINSLVAALDNISTSPSAEEVLIVLNEFKTLYQQLSAITVAPSNVNSNDFLSEFPKQLFNRILFDILNGMSPELFQLLRTLGIIEIEHFASTQDRVSYSAYKFNTNHLKEFLADPATALSSLYGWATQQFNPYRILNLLRDALYTLKIQSYLEESDIDSKTTFESHSDLLDDNYDYRLVIPIAGFYFNNELQLFGIQLYGYSLLNNKGLSVGLILPSVITNPIELSSSLKLDVQSSFANSGFPGVIISPSEIRGVLPPLFQLNDWYIEPTLTYIPENPLFLLGNSEASHLLLKKADLKVTIDKNADANSTTFEIGIDLWLKLVLSPGEGDGFVSKILDTTEKEIDFQTGISWHSLNGLNLKGGGSAFEVLLAPHINIGPLKINNSKLSAKYKNGTPDSVEIGFGASVGLEIGPLMLSIDNMGLKFNFLHGDGNAGPWNIDFGFKPPTGVGIAINSSDITGGGFLNFDEATKTYTGALELSFKKFSLSAFGIISTQLPDGSEGYSLLIFITAQFQPIQIGMGFTLTGVGGLLGLHRSTNIEYLRTGIRDNTLNHILFPTNIVENAPTIISTVNQAFPIQEGRFVFGPMAKIGWGTPTIMTMDLGIVIEVPDPVTLVILGVMRSILPDIDKQTLKLQVNFLGIIDFDKKQLSFDASIYDSKLLSFVLSGDLALRIAWGDTPNFLLSVGGFHPAYTPPPLNLPELRRISVQIFNEEDLRVRFECYFALTSNSAQFGAKLEAYAAAGNWNVNALLWFDLLFKFSPFHMLLNMGVQVSVRRKEKVILAAYLEISIEGPGPWRVWGVVSFDVGVNVSIDFDKTFGEGAMELNLPVAVLAKLDEAIDAKGNWIAEFPERNNLLVALRDLQLAEETLLAEPFGNLTFRQNALPLNVIFQKYGNAPLSDYKRFEIVNMRDALDNPVAAQTVTDFFASSEYYYLTDSERLSKPSYERFKSGVVISGTGALKSSYFVHKEFAYDEVIIDMRQRKPGIGGGSMAGNDFEAHLFGNAISESSLSATQVAFANNAPPRVSINTSVFTLANTNDLSVYGSTPVYFSSESEAEHYMDSLIASNNSLATQLIVVNELELVA